MNYNNKTIILALAATAASAIKIRSTTIFDDIVKAFEDLGDWVVDEAIVAEEIEPMWTEIGNFSNKAGDAFFDGFNQAGNAINDVIIDPTEDMLEDMWNGVENEVENAGNWIEDGVDDAGNWIEDGVDDAGNWIVDGADAVGDAFVSAGDALVGTEVGALEALGIDTAAMSAEEIALVAAVVLV